MPRAESVACYGLLVFMGIWYSISEFPDTTDLPVGSSNLVSLFVLCSIFTGTPSGLMPSCEQWKPRRSGLYLPGITSGPTNYSACGVSV